MSRRIIVEALLVVMRLRWDELRGRGPVAGTAVDGRPASAPGWPMPRPIRGAAGA